MSATDSEAFHSCGEICTVRGFSMSCVLWYGIHQAQVDVRRRLLNSFLRGYRHDLADAPRKARQKGDSFQTSRCSGAFDFAWISAIATV